MGGVFGRESTGSGQIGSAKLWLLRSGVNCRTRPWPHPRPDPQPAPLVGQDTVSRYEQRSAMLLSTLQSYIHAMGGELDLVVTFRNRKPVKLKSLGEVA